MKSLRMFILFLSAVGGLFLSAPVHAGTVLKMARGTFDSKTLARDGSLSKAHLLEPADYIIQFKKPIQEANKKQLLSLGVEIFRYLPDDALIVRAPLAVLNEYSQNSVDVQAVVPFKRDWKISTFLPLIGSTTKNRQGSVLVSLFKTQEREKILQKILAIDPQAVVLNSEERYISLRIKLSALAQIASLTGVEFVQKIQKMQSMDFVIDEPAPVKDPVPTFPLPGDYSDLTGFESGTKILNLEAAWTLDFKGQTQAVAMADTGLDLGDVSHVSNDFLGAIRSGYHFGAGASDWSDPMGHGTHVAGSVLGRGVISGKKILGAAYGAQLVVEGMWSPIVDNLNVPPQLSKLFEPAYQDGARIHTNSWGSADDFGAYESMAQKVDEYMWQHPDFLILYAAGNSGEDKGAHGKIDPNSIGAPATAKNCVTVGASKNFVLKGGIQKKVSELRSAKDKWPAEPIASSRLSETANGMAMFSSRGPTQDHRLKPDVVAPGTNILSERSHVPGAEVLWGLYSNDYAWSGGTSMATPLAAGFAAVTRDILMRKNGIANPSAALVKAVMMHTAFDMYPGQFGEGIPAQELTHRPNNDQGYGRLDMQKVLDFNATTSLIDSEGVVQGQTFETTVTLRQGQNILANMVYTDAPGTPAAAFALVNNLDLVLVSPTGEEIGSRDVLNNAEILELSGLDAGVYKIQVRGVNIPMGKNGKQAFALVFSVN